MMRSWMSLGPNKNYYMYVVFVKRCSLYNKLVIKYALLSCAMWSLLSSGLLEVVNKQRFYFNIHVYEDLSISIFYFHFLCSGLHFHCSQLSYQ